MDESRGRRSLKEIFEINPARLNNLKQKRKNLCTNELRKVESGE